MWKYFAFSALGALLLSGCSHRQIMLSKLKESDWYRSQTAWANGKNNPGFRINSTCVLAGQIKEVKYNYHKKEISDITLSPAHWLVTPEWFGADPVILSASNSNFKKGYFPAVGEYWAFGIIKGLKGRYSIKSAVKLVYDKNTEGLTIVK
jgi:hypothetical protein